ncbi:DUF2057 family protein [Vibrio hannami]|uniref:DUF2057 family protein n=1 Tax=Vibrio hannami TaxID=2717094 RepID=UPI00240F4F5E|nr:DUF2057 family protein [Vibrio hannami]MDG3088936.1 DUF2057 family protein [Vibrio hannami]
MKLVLCVLSSLLLTANVSAAEIKPENNIRLLIVDGVETINHSDPAELKSGFNQIAIKVFKTFGRGANKQIFESDPFLLMFEAKGEDITIYPPELKNYDAAQRHFKQQPEITLISNGKELVYEYAKLEGKKGFLPFGDLEGVVDEYNKQNGIQAGNVEKTAPEVIEEQFVPTFEQLKEWYPNMPVQEREAFKNWVVEQ